MSYSDLLGTIALGVTVVGAVFAYVIVPQRKRNEGWAIIGWIVLTALTLTSVWNALVFITRDGAPSRYEIVNAVVFVVGSMVGWGIIAGLIVHTVSKRMGPK